MENLFSTLSLVAALVSLFMGGVVLLRNPRETLNRIFCLLCLSVAYWAFIEFQFRVTDDFDAADTLIQMLLIWPWPSALVFHFALVFAEQKRLLDLKLQYYLAYIPALLISISYTVFHNVHGEPEKVYWGWTYQFSDLLFVKLEIIYVGILALFAVYFCLRHYRRLTTGIRKLQAKYITIGLSIPIFAGFITEVIPYQLDAKVPELTTISFAIGCGGFVSYAILKYELFVLTPSATAEQIILTMPGSLFLVNPDGIVQTVNRSAIELLGYPEKELVGKPLADMLSQEWVDIHLGPLKETQQKQSGRSISETSLISSSGEPRNVTVSTTSFVDVRGSYAGSIVVVNDITERKHAEEALRESEKKFRSVAESAAEAIICINREGIITYWNTGGEKNLRIPVAGGCRLPYQDDNS